MIKFEELDNLLLSAQAGSRAAECHGFLCGYLCVSDSIETDLFQNFLLADLDADLSADCSEQITTLAEDVSAQISSNNFDLQLLLPDDQSTLEIRSAALTQWCQGFLSGLGISGIIDFDTLSEESRELIDDMVKICRLDADVSEDDGEDVESAFMELVEYVRMGAIFIHDEFHNSPTAKSEPEVLH